MKRALVAFLVCLVFWSPAGTAQDEKAVADPQPPPAGPHAYFETLSKRPDVLAAYSLRDAAQIEKYTKPVPEQHVFYAPEKDADPRKQDAAKLVIPAGHVSLHNAFRLPIPEAKGKSVFVTWDAWFGKEFMYDNTKIGKYKNFQFASGRIWTEVRSRFDLGFKHQNPPAIAMVDVRQYDQEQSWPAATDTVKFNGIGYGGSVLGPMVGEFAVQPETWTRYWAYFVPTFKDNLFEFSLWVADEKKEAVRILDRVQIRPNLPNRDRWNEFWFEYNSSNNGKPPERVAYVRNVAMLAGATEVESLLEKPVK